MERQEDGVSLRGRGRSAGEEAGDSEVHEDGRSKKFMAEVVQRNTDGGRAAERRRAQDTE